MPNQIIDVSGRRVMLERRRYSDKTFTWAYLDCGPVACELPPGHPGITDWRSLGDPWPCINPPRAELEMEITRCQQQQQ